MSTGRLDIACSRHTPVSDGSIPCYGVVVLVKHKCEHAATCDDTETTKSGFGIACTVRVHSTTVRMYRQYGYVTARESGPGALRSVPVRVDCGRRVL